MKEVQQGRKYRDRNGTVYQVIEIVMSRAYPVVAVDVLTRKKATYCLNGNFLLGQQGQHPYDLIEEVEGGPSAIDDHPELDSVDYFQRIMGWPQ